MGVGTRNTAMDATAVLDAIREGNETALARLGSERALVAVTRASIERAEVVEAAAAAEARAAATFDAWTGDEGHTDAREAFAAAAEQERDHVERVVGVAEGASVDREPDPDALHEHLRGLDATIDRVGAGLVGRPLVASRTLLQVVNYFVNEGESPAAAVFRDLRAETDEQASTGATLVIGIAENAEEDPAIVRDRAVAAADRAIEVAYDEYADQLTEMGVDPKPVC